MSRTCKLILFAFIVLIGFILAHKSSINNRVSTKFSIPSQFADSQDVYSLVYTDGEGNLISSDNSVLSLSGVTKPTDIDVGENINKSYIFNDNDAKTLSLYGNGKSGKRTVKIYDDVEIMGNLKIGGKLYDKDTGFSIKLGADNYGPWINFYDGLGNYFGTFRKD